MRISDWSSDVCSSDLVTTALPAGLQSYQRTATFTEATMPAALMNDHSTKEGGWGLMHVEEGSLRYFITDARRPICERSLTPGSGPGGVEPTITSRVEASGRERKEKGGDGKGRGRRGRHGRGPQH